MRQTLNQIAKASETQFFLSFLSFGQKNIKEWPKFDSNRKGSNAYFFKRIVFQILIKFFQLFQQKEDGKEEEGEKAEEQEEKGNNKMQSPFLYIFYKNYFQKKNIKFGSKTC